MKLSNIPGLQFSDLLVYIIVPMAAVLLPAAWSRRMVSRVAAWRWVLRSEADASCAHAAQYTAIADEQEWKRRWRTVLLLDARDLYLMSWGRANAVLEEIDGRESIVSASDRVLVGMHWGPSIAVLKLLQSRGMNPLLVYRPVEQSVLRQRPWLYLFLRMAIAYIKKSCGERAIPIRGASNALREKLPMQGTSIVVLDAPPTPGRSTLSGEVLGFPVRFNAGFPEILRDSGREFMFYAISLQPGHGAEKILELTEARRLGSTESLVRDYCEFLGRHIGEDSAQWRIWQVAGQFFQGGSAPAAETPTPSS